MDLSKGEAYIGAHKGNLHQQFKAYAQQWQTFHFMNVDFSSEVQNQI